MLRDELQRLRDDSVKSEEVARSRLERQKAEFGDEREQLHRRIGEMEEQVGKLHEEAKKRDKQFLKVGWDEMTCLSKQLLVVYIMNVQ